MNEERWQVKALNFLREFASFGCQFMAEEARSYAYHHGLPEPKSHRAWGSVVRGTQKGIDLPGRVSVRKKSGSAQDASYIVAEMRNEGGENMKGKQRSTLLYIV